MRTIGLATVLLLLAAGAAQASTCERLRVASARGDAQLQGIYDFCSEYRRLQAEVAALTQRMQEMERDRRTERLQRGAGGGVVLAEVLRGAGRAEKRLSLARPAVLLATAYAADGAAVSLRLDDAICAAAVGSATCLRPLEAGEHTVATERAAGEIVLSVTLLER